MSATTSRLAARGEPQSRRTAAGLPGIFAFIALLHVLGWGIVVGIVEWGHLPAGQAAFGVGIAFTAYMLGVRHAFDADHIAAIDNTTRKLMQQGRRATAVGFWFSCGHSSVVFALALLLAFGVRSLAGPALDEASAFRSVAGLVGTVVSSCFLYAIAALNVVVLINTWRAFRRRPASQPDIAIGGGLMTRLVGRIMTMVTEPRQMYLVGMLFGFGFDTASEIALLVLTGSSAASGLPQYAVLSLPLLFAAGMSLFDTVDGAFMSAAYLWALASPARRVYYNLIVTGLSVAVALIIGTVEILGLISGQLRLSGSLFGWFANLDLSTIGVVIVGLFAATWLTAIGVAKCARLLPANSRTGLPPR